MARRDNTLTQIGKMSVFGGRAILSAFVPPFEWLSFFKQIEEVGLNSVTLIGAAGLSVGMVTALHTRGTLVNFGAESLIPATQSAAFFNEIGPLVTGLLIAGRVGAGIGAELANARATEQLDAIEAMSIDSFRFMAATRVLACIAVLPMLTVLMDFAGLLGGFFAEFMASHISFQLYFYRAFTNVEWVNFVPTTLKTCVFGFLIGTVSSFYGFTINEGTDGVRRAATNSVVVSSLMIILSDVILVKIIYFFFPRGAI